MVKHVFDPFQVAFDSNWISNLTFCVDYYQGFNSSIGTFGGVIMNIEGNLECY